MLQIHIIELFSIADESNEKISNKRNLAANLPPQEGNSLKVRVIT